MQTHVEQTNGLSCLLCSNEKIVLVVTVLWKLLACLAGVVFCASEKALMALILPWTEKTISNTG